MNNKEYIKEWRRRNSTKIREKDKRYRSENRDRINTNNRNRMNNNRQIWRKFLQDIGMRTCCICGYNKCEAAIEYHHTDPSKKDIEIHKFTRKPFSAEVLEELLSELDKCIVVCANCHREIHY